MGHAAWRRSLQWIGLSAAAMPVLMVALRYAAVWALDGGLLEWESGLLLWLGTRIPFSTAVFLQTPGSDPTLVMVIVVTAGIAAWLRRPLASVSIVLAGVVPDVVGRFGWLIWSRARPDLLYEGLAAPGFHSFPSGHTSKTMAVYGLLTLLWVRASGSAVERAAALLLLAVIVTVVPLGRMAMGAHWPSDVVGGMVIGGVWLAALQPVALRGSAELPLNASRTAR